MALRECGVKNDANMGLKKNADNQIGRACLAELFEMVATVSAANTRQTAHSLARLLDSFPAKRRRLRCRKAYAGLPLVQTLESSMRTEE